MSEVDLLFRALADVPDHHVAGRAVEREPPRVAQTVGPDLRTVRRAARSARALRPTAEWVAGWDRVRPARLRRDPQDLPEQRGLVLRVHLGVVPAAPIAHRDVEIAVRAELELATVVIALGRVRDRDQHALGGRAGRVAAGVGGELTDMLVTPGRLGAVLGRVIDVEPVARRVIGRERHRQQPLLAADVRHLARDVEERRGLLLAVLDQLDLSRLLNHEQPMRVSGRGRDVGRSGERAHHRRPDPRGRGRRDKQSHQDRETEGAAQHTAKPIHRGALRTSTVISPLDRCPVQLPRRPGSCPRMRRAAGPLALA